ncbi:MAG: hypothetical protein GWN99_19110 [Gemmatimonadetes bacterium]|uniref:DUF8201 domain-containing protein n=1 Tax=Candidatus Kutchimonas denitrificans TaxID=3056748 RepID=A0AAE4Z4T4_9BACT|nr:hypothetical protein [Gemmatimonadota bacterium]NIR73775.1 hypothetical protein [Candidatus Kutchimonas denitrificans]NIS03139.1 hypothetical protein [Gemmatimonadota bacterium]NIT69040.1 hypothetical protein [Gemmatimonadota bacterium]NIU54131.1 hypothetical protein [Gemmatimonadota bacterium]
MKERASARAWSILLVALTVGGGLSAVHLHVAQQGLDYSGPLLLLDHLFVLVVVLTLVAISTAVGQMALSQFAVQLGALENLVFGAAVGMGVMAVAFLVLGLVGGLYPITTVALPLGLGLVAHRKIIELPGLCRRAARELAPEDDDRALWAFGVSIFGAAMAFTLLYGMAPPVDWDALMYHLQVPKQFLEGHRVYLPVDNLHVSRVGLIHFLYLPLVALSSFAGPTMLGVVLTALLGLSVYSFCKRLLTAKTASLALGMLWGTTTILLVAITPRVDVSLAFYLFLAHYGLIVALSQPERADLFYLSAVLLGLAVGVKLSALPFIIGLGPLILWVVYSRSGTKPESLRPLTLFGIIFIAAALPWLFKNWLLLGAPLYPFLAAPILQPWLQPFFGSTEWPAAVDPELLGFIWELRASFNLRDAFFAPGRLTIEPEGAHYYLSPALLLLPLWFAFIKNKTLTWLVLPAPIFLFIVLVLLPSPNLRYLIPAAVPLTIVVAHMIVLVSERFLSKEMARVLVIALGCLSLVPTGTMARYWLTRARTPKYFSGTTSAEDYIRGRLGPGYPQVVTLANHDLAADSKILMVFDARGYYFERTVLQDNKGTNWPLISTIMNEDDCLESMNITHVLLGLGSIRYYVMGGLDPERVRWNEFQQFAARCLEPIYQDVALVLFRVKSQDQKAGSGKAEGVQ